MSRISKPTFICPNSILECIYVQLEKTLSNILNKFEVTFNKILPSKLNWSLIDKIKNNTSLKSLCEYNQTSETTIELRPKGKLKIKDVILFLHINNPSLIVENNKDCIKLSLPIITYQRRGIALSELSRIFEQCKEEIRAIRKDIIDKIKLVKGVCDSNRLNLLKRIDNSIAKTAILLSNCYSRNKSRLSI